ncbi:MAG: metal ABC transporter substrate-binding protein [Lachnospiraceae bacterium]|nr:metal ABC transporter substrate-binding protein [Lachnospiraceae bacterium]
MALVASNITGCSSKTGSGSKGTGKGGKIKIVTTIFPEYDWVKEIVKGNDKAEVSFLLNNGVDLHSFQPSAEDILQIGLADVFIYVGGESDEWVEDALKEVKNKDIKVINLMEVLKDSVKEEEMVEGMEEHDHEHEHEDADHEDADHEDHDDADVDHDDADADHEDADHEDHDDADADHDNADHEDHDDADADHEDADHEEHEHHHEEGEVEYDEHVWLSLRFAKVICETITEKVSEADPSNKSLYEKNFEDYRNKLTDLDEKYEKLFEESENKTILFGDRFPFRYMIDDYDLKYYAAFAGCSAESEASFETITFLSEKVDELSLNAIFQIETSDGKIAETIKDNTKSKDQEILTLDSLQSTTSKDVEDGKSYLKAMEDNYVVLDKAFGSGDAAKKNS